eukprot:60927-Prymnesium_polylepis.1
MPPVKQWNARYCLEARKQWLGRGSRPIERWVGVSAEHGAELHALLGEVMVRVRKEEVLHELPPKRRSKVVLQLKPSDLKAVRKQMASVNDIESGLYGHSGSGGGCASGDEEEGSGAASLPTPEVMRAFAMLADAKACAVCEWLESSLLDGSDTGGKTLVFAHHHSMHDAIGAFFGKALRADEWIRITGKTPQSERSELLCTFRTSPRCRFAVLALTACGVGLNLACADTAVFAELCWNPSTLEQAEARIHRMGQQATHVNVYYLLGGDEEDGPDNAMFGALVRKSRDAARAVDGGALPDDLGAV